MNDLDTVCEVCSRPGMVSLQGQAYCLPHFADALRQLRAELDILLGSEGQLLETTTVHKVPLFGHQSHEWAQNPEDLMARCLRCGKLENQEGDCV